MTPRRGPTLLSLALALGVAMHCQSSSHVTASGLDETLVPVFARTEVQDAAARAGAVASEAARALASERRALLETYSLALVGSFETLRRDVPELGHGLGLDVSRTLAARALAGEHRDALVYGAPVVAFQWLEPLRAGERYLAALDRMLAAVAQQEPERDRPGFLVKYQAVADAYNRWVDDATAAAEALNPRLEAAMLPRSARERADLLAEVLDSEWLASWPNACRAVLDGLSGAAAPRRSDGALGLVAQFGAFALDPEGAGFSAGCREALRPLVDALVACRGHAEGGVSDAHAISAADVLAIVEAAAARFTEQRSACP